MAHGLNSVLKRSVATCKGDASTTKGSNGGIGSRRIFAPHFKLQVLDSYRNDADCKGNQRATARKYGIHRRQIQKWLQVENNLRNSVGKTVEENPTRQPGDQSCNSSSRSSSSNSSAQYNVPDPQAPMDLSLKRPTLAVPLGPPQLALGPSLISIPSPPVTNEQPPPHPDVWDLSIKRKPMEFTTLPPKPVKLFKPYLDDEPSTTTERINKSAQLSLISYCNLPCCCPNNNNNNNNINNNNNNNNDYNNTYTLHELQPNNFYYYPTTPPPEYEPFVSYEDPYSSTNNFIPLKQRHSYSLDFKLKTIDCYYQDSTCKGNQRAVATKYNIHRRQVQKWLKQADELRQRNETIKQTQIVR